ncbi:MAG: PhoH family protein [Vulcanimicrobiota bacterium]
MTEARKIYLLDTSVLLHRPESIYSFGEHRVVIPIVVLDELDTFKRGSMQIHRNARRVISMFDELRQKGRIFNGVKLDNGGTLVVDTVDEKSSRVHLPAGFERSADNHILATAVGIKLESPEKKVVLVTKDINMRVKAEALGLLAEDYRADQIVDPSEMYTGHAEVMVSQELIDQFYREKTLPVNGTLSEDGRKFFANQFLMLVCRESPSVTALARYDGHNIELLRDPRHDIWGIRPLNREQRYAVEVLLDDNIPLVTLAGKAGTGKTILAIAAGLQKVVNDKIYRRLSVYRPVVPMGRDIGYLPGSEQEKLAPWMQPIYDNLEFLLNEGGDKKTRGSSKMDYLVDSNVLDIRALTYIRGRSLPHQFIIVDEAQNLTPHEVKTIVTRVGHGTKLVLTGDPYQIDSPYLDSTSNGLTHVVERFREQKIAAHITLQKGERSALAELASEIMER